MSTTASHPRPHPRGSLDPRDTARALLQTEIERLPPEEREVVERFVARRKVARNISREFPASLSLGQRVADRVARVGGSWRFIIGFGAFLVVWMALNSAMGKAFDPYPFILLNLVLSCLAALQAPVIMMSQNRQAEADRMQAQNDYEVNVKSELEILQVHEKLNDLRERDWATLVELQNRQIEMLQQLLQRATESGPWPART